MIQRSAWTDQAGGSLKHETSACCVHCRLRLYPWLWYFSLSVTLAWPTPPPLSSLTPHQSRAEFTFFTNPLSSATKTLSSPDQNRPVDTSSRVPRRSLSSTNWLTERRKMSYGETRKRDEEKSQVAVQLHSRGISRGEVEGQRSEMMCEEHLQSEAVNMRNDH